MSDGPTPWRRYYTGRNVERALDIPELRAMARRRRPMFVREYLEVGADTESTLLRNRRAFDDYRWVHKVANEVTPRSLATNILGVPSWFVYKLIPPKTKAKTK